MQKIQFVKDAVINRDLSDKTIEKLIILKNDNENLPVFKVPLRTFVTAALSVLEVEPYNGEDEDVLLWENNLKHLT